jgi:ParB family chromosome partitioning protein
MSKTPKLVPPPIHMRPLNELYLASEAPKGANLVVRDSGRGSPLTDAELKASIYASGIIHPLIYKVYEDKCYAIAGNRRLKFLREIFEGAPSTPVQTQDVADFNRDWREVAIDTNLSLPPHLVERYELIVALAKDLKLQPADVQARYGMTPRQYLQVMALGKMSANVRAAWKAAEIDAKAAQAFTLEPDTKEQDRILASLKGHHRIGEYDVRRKIVPSNQREAGRMVAFLGVDVVRKAKLIKHEDLFSNDHVVTDVKALNKLVGDKMALKCKELVEAGWSWAVPEHKIEGTSVYYYGTLEPSKKSALNEIEKKRLAEIHDELYSVDQDDDFDDAALIDERERIEGVAKDRGFTPEQRKKGGCIVKIGHDGKLVIDYGRVKPSEKKSVTASERASTKKKAKAKKPGVVTLTNALAERLSVQLEKALQASIHATPDVAVAALIAAFASSGHVLDVEVAGDGRNVYGKNSSPKNFASVFEGAVKATPESRVIMLCKVAAAALSIQVSSAEAKSPVDDEGVQALVAKMDGKYLNNAIAVEFDAKDYFAGVSLQACVDAVRAACGDGAAAEVAKMKKSAAAQFAAGHVVKEGWLPRELRTVHYKGPVEKAAPAKAPKPVKLKAKKPKSLLSKKQQRAVRAGGIRAGKAAMAQK